MSEIQKMLEANQGFAGSFTSLRIRLYQCAGTVSQVPGFTST